MKMNLAAAITHALDITTRLHVALTREDVDLCAELLDARSLAMERFEASHRNAQKDEKTACAAQLMDLIQADQALQKACTGNLAILTAEFRTKVTSGPLNQPNGYDTPPQQACVDRKV